MYRENDKVMILETGEVLTVIADLSDQMERGIVVKENIGRNLMPSEVRPMRPYPAARRCRTGNRATGSCSAATAASHAFGQT